MDVRFSEFAKFQPKQLLAYKTVLEHDCSYLLYGGAMHGGKSYFLRWIALGLLFHWWQTTGQAGITVGLFSEDYPTLKDRQISKIIREFPPYLGSVRQTKTEGLCFYVNDEYGGGRIALRNLDDAAKYQSSEYAAILVEELTKNTFETFTDLRTRNRWPGIEDPKFVGATNPGGIGHVWCKKYWITRNSGDLEQALFKYIPATMDDNRYTTAAYRRKIEALPEKLRKAYLFGDWDAFEGQFFSSFDPTVQLIDPFEIDPGWTLVGSMDPGWSSPLSFGLQARSFKGFEYRIGTYYEAERDPDTHAGAIREWLETNPWTGGRMPSIIVAGKDAWSKKDRYATKPSDKDMNDVFSGAPHHLFLQPAVTDRHNGWGSLKMVMPKQYFIFKYAGNDPLVDQLTQTVTDELDKEDIQGRGRNPLVEDHALDDARYGHMATYRPTAKAGKGKKDWKEQVGQDPSVPKGYMVGDPT